MYPANLPQDPIMLISAMNMLLRDRYGSLDELCEDLELNKSGLLTKLQEAGFEYDAEHNRFW